MEEQQKRELDWLQADDQPTSFAAATKELASLGALSVDEFLTNVGSAASMYELLFAQPTNEVVDVEKESIKIVGGDSANAEDVVMKEEDGEAGIKAGAKSHVAALRTMAQNVFGSSECLKWEFLEKDDEKQCILTITRPNGVARSYKSSRGFARRQEARADASQIAVEMGALDFIVSGDADAMKAKKGLLLNPFDVEVDRMEQDDEVNVDSKPKYLTEEEPLQQINECCEEWRAGKVKPHWVAYTDAKNKTKKRHGTALKISLNPHVFRAYSVDPMYDTVRAARIACAKVAIDQGVIEFIQFGNGQLEPAKVIDDGAADYDMDTLPDYLPMIPAKGISLQDYYESLPQPFPEEVGQQTASEINAPAWVNMAIQSARGGRLVLHFIPIADSERNLHGSIIRIQRPGETRTYFVDPMFAKRGDAKSAVCLLAMSQGVGDYIRGLKEEAENKLPAERRKLANEKVLQVLSTESTKIRAGNRLIFVYQSERDAFGCTLKVDVSEDADKPDVREYTVPVEYRTKADAKAAVAVHAAEQGLVDVLRFKGVAPPADYIPFWEAQQSGDGDQYVPKRKDHDRDDDRDRRKRRKGNHTDAAGRSRPSTQPSTPSTLPTVASLPPKPPRSSAPLSGNVSLALRHKKPPPVSGSRGLDQPGANASAARPGGQDRSGNRNGSGNYHNRDARLPNAVMYDQRPPQARMNSVYLPPPQPHLPPQSGYGQPQSYGPAYPSPYPQVPPPNQYGPPTPAPVLVPPPGHHHPAYYGSPPAPTPSHLHPHDPYARYPPPVPPPPLYPHAPQQPPYPGAPYVDPRYMSPPAHPHTPSHEYPPLPPHGGYTAHPNTYDSRYPRSPPHPHFVPPSPSHQGYHDLQARAPYPPDYQHHSAPPQAPPRPAPDYGQRPPNGREPGWRSPNGNSNGKGNGYHGQANGQHRRSSVKQENSTPVINPPLRWTPNGQPTNQNNKRPSPSNDSPSDQAGRVHPPPEVSNAPEPTPPPREAPAPAPQPESSRSKLTEFCVKESIPTPRFFYEAVEDPNGKTMYKVWAEKDAHRLELQNRFDSVDAGYEKLSKKVLEWELGRMRIKT